MPLPLLPSLTVQWGDYDKADPEEESKIVTTVRTALGGAGGGEPLITRRLALQKIRTVFGVENVDAVLDELEQEGAERQEKALEQAQKMSAITVAPQAAPGAPGQPKKPAPFPVKK